MSNNLWSAPETQEFDEVVMLLQTPTVTPEGKLTFTDTDLEIRAQLGGGSVVINVLKAGTCVHRVTIADAVGPMEHNWIADLFAREDRVELKQIVRDAEEYVSNLNINQG
jgi:hypothetical protein